MSDKIPVARHLTEKQLQERRKNYLEKAAESLTDSAELSDGCVFRFRLGESIVEDLAKIIELERQCCPFLNFRLFIEAGTDFVALEMTGADGTKEIVDALFNWR